MIRNGADFKVLRMWADDGTGPTLLQHDAVGHLLSPIDLVKVLEDRRGSEVPNGTVVLSGTIAGEPTPGQASWSAEFDDPHRERSLKLAYSMTRLTEEL